MRTKTSPNSLTSLLAAVGVTVATMSALGQTPIISSFSQNGRLICTNLQPGSLASVEWASSPAGPWTNNWAGLDAVTVDSNGMIQVSVPMFYRVRGFVRATNTFSPPTNMVLIPAGLFTMGDPFNEGDTDEFPLRPIYVSAFYVDRTEVTKALWNDVYQWATNHGYAYDNPGLGKAANHPVHTLSWYDMVKWCNARSEKEGRTPAYYTSAAQTTVYRSGTNDLQENFVRWNTGYRLPTEAEWEKAARGGVSGHRFPWSNVETIMHSQANYNSSASYAYDTSPTRGYHPNFQSGGSPYTSPVGYFAPNGYGLYDMTGNVWEWCWDWYGSYPSGPQTDPHGVASGSFRAKRGGSWIHYALDCRSASRSYYGPSFKFYFIGFRTVLPPAQ